MADQGGFQTPAAPQAVPGFPQNFFIRTFDGFDGLNTKPTRPAIEDQQMYICDNLMPLGKNNLRTLYDKGTAIYTAAGALTISYFAFGNIADTAFCLVFLSDGSIVQVNTTTLVATTVAAAGTITVPTNQLGVAQWGSQYILIVAPQTNGYFIWDGTLLYQAGSVGPAVTITNSGNSYATNPQIVAISGISGQSSASPVRFSSTITSGGAISQITVTSAGAGFTATSYVTLAFSSGGSNTTAIAYASIVGGGITNISIANGGSGYTAATTVTFQGGGGVGATATVTASGSVNTVTITAPGEGYITAPTVVFSDPNNAVARANLTTMPFGVQGTAIETFTNRVWIANGAAPTTPPNKNLEIFSAAGSPTDFGTTNGGGSFTSTDSFLRVGIHAIRQANGFMYNIGDSSVNYISGVQTSGTPPTTTFSNQNVDPQVGSPWPDSVQVYSRAIVFANTFGVHALYGGAIQKVSGPLDGIYTTVAATGAPPLVGGILPSSAVSIIFGIHVYILLMPILDQITGLQRNALLMWDGSKWWTASQSVTLTRIASQEINSVLTAYGSDGTSIYPLFNTASTAITKTVRSKLWDNPSYLITKHAQRVLGLFQTSASDAVSFTVSVDTESKSQSVTITNLFGVNWLNNQGLVATWMNNSAQIATWQTIGLSTFVNVIENSGALIGITLQTTSMDCSLISLATSGQQYSPRL